MLVLARRTNDRIILPTIQTTIQVVSIKPGMVRLGISAPDHVPVYREELLTQSGAADPSRLTHRPLPLTSDQLACRLDASIARLSLARRLLDGGQTVAADVVLRGIQTDLACMQNQMSQSQTDFELRLPEALLVEDDHNERELLAGILRFAGVHVTAVSNGNEALNYLRTEKRPDVVLLDMMLPDVDAHHAIREIRNDPANSMLKIFGICQSAVEASHAEDDGVDRVVVKPLNPETLLCDLLSLSLAS
jgi:carbon storage regulator CsrA